MDSKNVATRYIPCQRFSQDTFSAPSIRSWVEENIRGRVLNPCAGESVLNHDRGVVRNDIREEIDADSHVDAAELATLHGESSFDTIVFDPPWSLYQSNLRYDGHHVSKSNSPSGNIDIRKLPMDIPGPEEKSQLGHARLVKEGFNYLLRPRGRVVELTFHGTCMPARMGFTKWERVVFDPVGEGKAVIGSVDIAPNE